MQRYKDWAPTKHDAKGLRCYDNQDWFVAPVIQTKISETRERSNFQVVLDDLEKADTGEDVEVCSFNHWGPGWFEIILVRPDTVAATCAAEWEAALSDYPIADESHLAELEAEEESNGF
jgi:hypothetical protein